jgi:hypothetical protein
MSTVMGHEESWLLLPWVASGRLSQAERARVEEHVHGCAACAAELVQQRLMCDVLAEPERVTYAPGPSFRKLMERIDGRPAAVPERRSARVHAFPAPVLSAWRPPGLAFAASFVAVLGLTGAFATAYRWSQPVYATATHSDPALKAPGVLHMAFVPSLPVGQAEDLLRTAGARVVEGPDPQGIFGVAPSGSTQPDGLDLRSLAQRLQADARVLWVEPLAGADASAAVQEPGTRER